MTEPLALVDAYANESDFDRGDLLDDREHMAPAAFDALRAVLALHTCGEGVGWEPDDDDTPGAYGDIARACITCGTLDEYAVHWPCPTVRAITKALGGES